MCFFYSSRRTLFFHNNSSQTHRNRHRHRHTHTRGCIGASGGSQTRPEMVGFLSRTSGLRIHRPEGGCPPSDAVLRAVVRVLHHHLFVFMKLFWAKLLVFRVTDPNASPLKNPTRPPGGPFKPWLQTLRNVSLMEKKNGVCKTNDAEKLYNLSIL